jgi:hypothetical protein
MKTKVYSWVCKECDKEIASLSKKQFEYNKEIHIISHRNKKIKKEAKEVKNGTIN